MTDPLRPPETDDEPWAAPEDELNVAIDIARIAVAVIVILALLALAWIRR